MSRYGLIAFASSLDRVGPFTNTVKDAATVLGVLAGQDPLDATSSDRPVDGYVAALSKPVAGLKVGVPAEYFGEGLDPEVRAAVEKTIAGLEAAGCVVTPVHLPHTKVCCADLLRDCDGGGFFKSFAIRWGAVRVAVWLWGG